MTGFTIRITGLLKFPGHKCEKLSDFQDKGQFLLLPGHFQDPNGIPGHFQDFQDFQGGWPPWSVDDGNTWTALDVPTGCYELKAEELKEIMRIRGNSDITISPNAY